MSFLEQGSHPLGFDNNGELSEWRKHSVSSRNKQETAEQMMTMN
jgi:hypothetical protein